MSPTASSAAGSSFWQAEARTRGRAQGTSRRSRPRAPAPTSSANGAAHQGQRDPEPGAGTLGQELDRAAVVFDEAPRHRQAQAGAALLAFADERLEDPPADLLRHAGPLVG